MASRRYRLITNLIYCLAVALAALSLTASQSLGQQPTPGTTSSDIKGETQERQNREMQLRSFEMAAAVQGVNQKRVQASIEQVKQDFRRIQVVRNEMVNDLLAKKPLDHKLVSEQAGEINKRAGRLKAFLMQPTPDEKEKAQKDEVEFNNEEMKGALVRLCNLIYSFTENPVLKTPGTVDVQQSVKAGRDLLHIIELSNNIRKNAERLGKLSK
ncbi:MAG TPA: hypothetical protein VGB17_00550 [Pyrinomonadaceae bacterium]|jgi:hypothetical protein